MTDGYLERSLVALSFDKLSEPKVAADFQTNSFTLNFRLNWSSKTLSTLDSRTFLTEVHVYPKLFLQKIRKHKTAEAKFEHF